MKRNDKFVIGDIIFICINVIFIILHLYFDSKNRFIGMNPYISKSKLRSEYLFFTIISYLLYMVIREIIIRIKIRK